MLTFTSEVTSAKKVPESEHNVARVNSIKHLYKHWRQESKVPTFALTYDGTYITLMKNLGLSEELAKSIEKNYHLLYEVSDKWVADKIAKAAQDGYVTIAFGLRLRTPLLHQVVMGTSKTPFEAAAEGRTAGNALGQSWCMLNSRAGSEFMTKVRNSDFRLDIKPCAQIHDAGYFLIRDDMETVLFTNKWLSKAVSWQEDPLIQNEHISMSGKLGIFHPNWNHEMEIPNDADAATVKSLIRKHNDEMKGK